MSSFTVEMGCEKLPLLAHRKHFKLEMVLEYLCRSKVLYFSKGRLIPQNSTCEAMWEYDFVLQQKDSEEMFLFVEM